MSQDIGIGRTYGFGPFAVQSRPQATRERRVEAAPLDRLNAELLTLAVLSGSRLHGVTVAELRLPRPAVVSLIIRKGGGPTDDHPARRRRTPHRHDHPGSRPHRTSPARGQSPRAPRTLVRRTRRTRRVTTADRECPG